MLLLSLAVRVVALGAVGFERLGLFIGQITEPFASGVHVLISTTGNVDDHDWVLVSLGLEILSCLVCASNCMRAFNRRNDAFGFAQIDPGGAERQ